MPRHRDQSESTLDYESAVAVWHRRRRLAVLVSCAVLTGAVSLAGALPDVYRATATVLVERQQVSEAFVRPSVTAELETRIQTIHRQIMSRERLTKLMTALDLYPDLRRDTPTAALVERMRDDVKLSLNGVEQTTGHMATISFSVSYSGPDPVTVADVVNTLVASYVEENTKSRERQAARTAEFLGTQLEAVKQELDEQEGRSAQFKARHAAELPQQVEANLAALDRLNTRLRLNGEYQVRAMERRERLEHQLTTGALPSQGRPEPESRASQLARLRRQLADLRTKYSDRYPDVVRVTTEIAALERESDSPAPGGLSSGQPAPTLDDPASTAAGTLTGLERDLDSLRQEERLLRQSISIYEARVENAPKRDEELQTLSRGYQSSRDRYDSLLKRYEEAQLAESLERGQSVEQFRILDPAIPAAHPAAPNRRWLLMMGLVASLGFGFAAMVIAERLDTTFHSADDLREFAAVPTVAAIRRIPTVTGARRRQLRFAVLAVSFIVALAAIVAGARYVAAGNEQLVRLTARGAQ
jgi:polysaccharide chain length determinant protein (PEP-CTERM system associated)